MPSEVSSDATTHSLRAARRRQRVISRDSDQSMAEVANSKHTNQPLDL